MDWDINLHVSGRKLRYFGGRQFVLKDVAETDFMSDLYVRK
jgi:hypothetical protein